MRWKANWIWCKGEEKPRNFYLYVRKTLNLTGKIVKAEAYCSADSRYKLYINGKFIGRGPARCNPRWQYYEVYDLKKYLQPGKNVIAALVHHYGEGTFSYILGRGGFLFQAEITVSNGKKISVVSDKSWKVKKCQAWEQNTPRIDIQLGFVEIYDANKEISGWLEADFDDSDWEEPVIIGRPPVEPWKSLVPRDIPMLLEEEILPVHILEVGECEVKSPEPPGLDVSVLMAQEIKKPLKKGQVSNLETILKPDEKFAVIRTPNFNTGIYIVLDFGKEVVGFPRIRIRDSGGGIIDLGYSELLENGQVNPNRAGVKHADRYIMRQGAQSFELFDKRGFRYMQLSLRNCPKPVKLESVSLNFSTYPVEYKGSFESSDPLLNRIWELGRYTLQLCMEDGYEDCPWRERGQWWGDARVEALINYYAFGDTKLIAKGLRQMAQSQRSDGLTMGVYPASYDTPLPSFSLIWVISLWDYYQFTGDAKLVKELYHNVCKLLEWFKLHINKHGLLEDVPHWVFIDWADLDIRGEVTALNCFFYKALLDAAAMAKLVKDAERMAEYEKIANKVRNGLNRRLWNKDLGVYMDCRVKDELSPKVSQQANALTVLFDIAEPKRQAQILDYISDETKPVVHCGSPYFSFYLLSALYHTNRHKQALSYIRRRWEEMLAWGATSCWEVWNPGASLCHGWAGGPTHNLSAEFLGVKPTKPGFEEFSIIPHPVDIGWAKGTVPTVKGDISVHWKKGEDDKAFWLKVEVPKGSQAYLSIPKLKMEMPEIILNNKIVWRNGKSIPVKEVSSAKEEPEYITFLVKRKGTYELKAKSSK